jgi:5-methylcytosine-specific restriction endonuclease McrA
LTSVGEIKKAAKAAGSLTYDTGKPCKYGHVAPRYVNNGHCLVCSKENQKRFWEREGPERKNARWRKWAEDNREHRNAYKRSLKWRPSKEAKAKWARENPDKIKACYKRYYEKNKDRFRVKVRNRYAMTKGASGAHSLTEIALLLGEQSNKCVYCRSDLSGGYHVDHRLPLSRGGANDISNIQLLCPPCNLSKGAKTHEEYCAVQCHAC